MAFKQKLILLAFILLICASHVLASASDSFQVNDESLDFGYNAGLLQSGSFVMDLAGINWVDRNAESDSYIVIDSNSAVGVSEPASPPSGGGSGGSSGGGGSAIIIAPDSDLNEDPEFESDIPLVSDSETQPNRDLTINPEEDPLHESIEENDLIIEKPPLEIYGQPVIKQELYDAIALDNEDNSYTPKSGNNVGSNQQCDQPYVKNVLDIVKFWCIRWDFIVIYGIIILITIYALWSKRK